MNEERHRKLNEAKWDSWAETLDEKSWRNDFLRKAQANVITLLDMKDDISVLDIGCGTGWALQHAAELNNGKGNFFGVDLSEKMIEKAEQNFKDKDNFHFLKANAESVPLEDNMCDIIICTNSFHHYLHPDKALNEMKRLLKNDGKLYILDPTTDMWLIKLLDRTLFKMFEPSHVKLYSTKEFMQLFESAGLKYLNTVRVNSHEKIHIGTK